MAHEILEHDGVVFHGKEAWHGLGKVVADAPTPTEALEIAGLNWTVDQPPLLIERGDRTLASTPENVWETTPIESHVANVRSDTQEVLGVVGSGWTPFQNAEMAEFAEALAEGDDVVKIESAGSIRNGRKVWFLLKGESFSVRGGGIDELAPYILLSNGFDGATSFRGTPTTIRVVCSNTLHMVIPKGNDASGSVKLSEAAFVFRHTAGLSERLDEAKNCLALYGRSLAKQRELIDTLAGIDVNSDGVKKFFLDCYTHDFGAVAETPTTKVEENRRNRAMEGFNAFGKRFDSERDVAGATAWNALNAYTGWLQHDKAPRVKDAAKAAESRLHSNLFGTTAARSIKAFETALAI